MPTVTNPSEVKEIVFLVGLNDLRKGFNPKEIQENVLLMQLKYNEVFPNALPPMANRHIETNRMPQRLSTHTDTNFISTKTFRDTSTGKLRANLGKSCTLIIYEASRESEQA